MNSNSMSEKKITTQKGSVQSWGHIESKDLQAVPIMGGKEKLIT